MESISRWWRWVQERERGELGVPILVGIGRRVRGFWRWFLGVMTRFGFWGWGFGVI